MGVINKIEELIQRHPHRVAELFMAYGFVNVPPTLENVENLILVGKGPVVNDLYDLTQELVGFDGSYPVFEYEIFDLDKLKYLFGPGEAIQEEEDPGKREKSLVKWSIAFLIVLIIILIGIKLWKNGQGR